MDFRIKSNEHHSNKIYDDCSEQGRTILRQTSFKRECFGLSCFQVIDYFKLDFYEGNCLKYIWRLGRKQSYQSEIEKIRNYAEICVKKHSYLSKKAKNKNFIREVYDCIGGLSDKRTLLETGASKPF